MSVLNTIIYRVVYSNSNSNINNNIKLSNINDMYL